MLSAVAIAKIFKLTIVKFIQMLTAYILSDPNKIPVAKKIDKISYEEMLELSSLGAKVMQSSAVQTAMMYDIPRSKIYVSQTEKEQNFQSRKY